MLLIYEVTYEEKDDLFSAIVYYDKTLVNIFSISATPDMINLISSGVMTHIDDVVGLKRHLINKKLVEETDSILIESAFYG